MLDEIVRVLATGGVVRMNNFDSWRADHWWLYRYFPAAVAIDRTRCWPVERIVAGLAARGVSSEFAITMDDHAVPLATMLEDARRRDISELNLIPEPAYEAGLDAIARDARLASAAVPCGLPLYSLLGRRR